MARILITGLLLIVAAGSLSPIVVAAQGDDPLGIKNAAGQVDLDIGGGPTKIESLIQNIIKFLLGLVSLLTFGAVIWGGIMYITSLGNEQRTGTAKRIIMYALVGLVIVILSGALVNFVINKL